jgi:hypothetical protein
MPQLRGANVLVQAVIDEPSVKRESFLRSGTAASSHAMQLSILQERSPPL